MGETPSLTEHSSLESGATAEPANGIVLSLTPLAQTAPQHRKEGCLPWQIPEALLPYNIKGALRQRNMAQMK